MDDELFRAAAEHFARGNAFDESGERERAIKEWQEAVHLNPDHAAAHFNLGIAFSEEGETDLAIEQLREAIRLVPFDTEARRELAEVYLEADRADEAINVLRQSLNTMPGDVETAHCLAEIYLDQAMWDEAAAALEAGGMVEEDADLWYDLGKAYEGESRREEAVLAYRRALVCHPGHRAAEQALDRMHIPIEEPPDPEEIE
jgi:tetratricopeptide (TPR) repeat protein